MLPLVSEQAFFVAVGAFVGDFVTGVGVPVAEVSVASFVGTVDVAVGSAVFSVKLGDGEEKGRTVPVVSSGARWFRFILRLLTRTE